MTKIIPSKNPRVIAIQKLYSLYINKDEKLEFKKNRYRGLVKKIVLGTLERKELIEKLIEQHLKCDSKLLICQR